MNPETSMEERGSLTLHDTVDMEHQSVCAHVQITLRATPNLHPSWTNHALLRLGQRLQDVVNEELGALKLERELA